MLDQRSRVTVVGAQRRVDVALPSAAPVGEYAGRLAELCGQERNDVFPAAWSLAPVGGAAIDPSDTLATVGVLDGAVLYLTNVAGDPAGDPVIEDVEELVAEETDRRRARQVPRGTVVVALALLWLLGAGIFAVAASDGHTGAAVALAFGGLTLSVVAWLLSQRRSAVPPWLTRALSLGGAASFAAAGALVAMALANHGAWWIGLVIGANIGVIMALATTPEVVFVAVELQLLVAAVLTVLLLSLRASPVEAAAAVTVAAVALLGAARWVAASLTAWTSRLPAPKVSLAQTVTRMLIQARGLLTLVIAVPVLALLVALPVLAATAGWFAGCLAGVTALGLLVRTRQAGFVADMVVLGVGGFVGLFAVVAAVSHRLGGVGFATFLLVLCGLAVAGLGLTGTLVRLPLKGSTSDVSLGGAAASGRRPAADVLGLLCNLAVAPLAMGVFGVYRELGAIGGGLVGWP
jgi:hypothetical protein